ncbi:MAG: hypothetical protein ACOC1G_03280 [Phycisphaeraceae bacterium]
MPWPDVAVVEMVEIGPLAERSVVLRPPVDFSGEVPARGHVAEPVWYEDGSTRWRLLAEGSVQPERRRTAAGVDETCWVIRDAWAQRLDEPALSAWSERDGRLVAEAQPRLGVSNDRNRSATRHHVHGASVYVPTATDGEAWCVAEALAFLAASLRLPIAWQPVARQLDNTPLTGNVDLGGTIRDALTPLLEAHGLALRLAFAGDLPRGRYLEVMTRDTARRVDIPRLASGQPNVLETDERNEPKPATQWTARGGVNEVESTFPLVGGWDPALESAADTQYDRTLSTDFPAYRDVFRTWVPNEDGRYSGEPFSRGPAPDLAALLENPFWSPQPLRLLDTLSLDVSGQVQPPRVEISFGSGGAWVPYPGHFVVLADRAGVRLEDDALPDGWIAANRSGAARLRVTATLRDPQPLSHRRWDGNALRDRTRSRSVEAGKGFARSRVDPASVLHGSPLGSRECDDRNALAMWLDAWIDRQRHETEGSRLRLRLPGPALTTLRAGDRVRIETATDRFASRRVVEVRLAFTAASNPGTTIRFGR